MKRIFFIILLLFSAVFGFSQSDTSHFTFHFYYPNGDKYPGNPYQEKKGHVHQHLFESNDNFTTVGFKMFTNKVLWIETQDSTKIDSAIASFNLDEYYKSAMSTDLWMAVENKNISEKYFIETLGEPDSIIKTTENQIFIDIWKYVKINYSFKFSDSLLIAYKEPYSEKYRDAEEIKKIGEDMLLKDSNYYWLSENYCKFRKRDTVCIDQYCGQALSKFKVLYQQGDFAFIQFKRVSTDRMMQDTVKIEAQSKYEDNVTTPYIVNTEDTFALELKDFSTLDYQKIGNDKYSDYVLKGKMTDKNDFPLSNKAFLLTLDENYGYTNTYYLKTNKMGEYEFGDDTMLGFLCTMGVRNHRAYERKHKYIFFTIIIDGKSFKKKMKMSDSDMYDKPIVFDINY